MKKLGLVLIGLMLLAFTAPAEASEFAEIDEAALKTLMNSDIEFYLFDARAGKYDDGNRIPGAKFLSYECSADEAAAAIPSKDSLVVTYCASPTCPASGWLAKRLSSLGYVAILEYPEGIRDWKARGNSVTREQ